MRRARKVWALMMSVIVALDIYLDYRADRLLRRKWVPGRGPTLGDCLAYARSKAAKQVAGKRRSA